MDKNQNIFTKLVEKAQTTKLTEREKAAMFSAVDSFVKKNPITTTSTSFVGDNAGQNFDEPIRSPFWSFNNFEAITSSWTFHHLRPVVAGLLIIVFGIGGTSAAAQNSLPGDLLYPVMVNINENIKSALLTGASKVNYEVSRAQKRVTEAAKLAAENRLSPEVRDQVVAALNTHVARVQKEVSDLTEDGDYKVAFEASTNLENTLSSDDVAVVAIEDLVREPLQASVAARESTENQILAVNIQGDEGREIAEAKLESTQNLIAAIEAVSPSFAPVATTMSAVVADESVDPVDSKPSDSMSKKAVIAPTLIAESSFSRPDGLDQVQSLIAFGQESFDNENYSQAFGYFKEAYDLADKVRDEIKFDKSSDQKINGTNINSTTTPPEKIDVKDNKKDKSDAKKIDTDSALPIKKP